MMPMNGSNSSKKHLQMIFKIIDLYPTFSYRNLKHSYYQNLKN